MTSLSFQGLDSTILPASNTNANPLTQNMQPASNAYSTQILFLISTQTAKICLKDIYLSEDTSDFYLYWQIPFRLNHSSYMPIEFSMCICYRDYLIALIISTHSLRTTIMS